MKRSGVKAMAAAMRGLVLAHGAWVALVIALLFSASPGVARAATCAIDFSAAYNATNVSHVMSMASNPDEFSACDPRKVATPGDPFSGFTPAGQAGVSANGGSFSTQAGASDDTITYTAPTGFSGVDTFVVYFCDDSTCSLAGRRTANVSVTVGTPTIVVNPANLPGATVYTAYNQTLTGSGGAAPYGDFIVTAGALPAGLSLNSSSGALTGTPTAAGSFNFTIGTTDSTTGTGPHNGSRAYTLTVDAPTITVGPTSLGTITQDEVYQRTLTATGGAGPYSFAVTSGTLPPGLQVSSIFLIGRPTASGFFTFTLTATDSSTGAGAPYTGSRTYTVLVNIPQPPSILPVLRFVPHNSVNHPIQLDFSGSVFVGGILIPGGGGSPTSVTTPTLPSHGTVRISGTSITYTPTPGYAGSDSFTYRASNSGGTSNTATVTLAVELPTIIVDPFSLPDGATGVAYSQTVAATGGSGPYTYAVTSGTPPDGLTLSAGGALSGTPTGVGPYSFTVTATDTGGNGPHTPFTGAQAYTVTIVTPTQAIANPSSATVAHNSANNPIALNITGGAPTSVTVSTPAANGTAAAAGTAITYTPTAGYSGPDSFAYTATNADGTSAPATVTITVDPQPPIAGAVTATVAQDSGANPITLNITGGLPTSVNASAVVNGSLVIAGTSISFTPTPGYSGPASFTYTATNAGGTSAPATVTITVSPQPPVAAAVSATVAYNSSNNPITLNLTGGPPTSVATPGLPAHGTVSIAGAAITYTPTAGYAGSDSFTYTATNAGGTSAPATVTVIVNPPPAPTAGAVSVTVAANSSNNAVPLNLGGGAPASVATPGPPTHGTVGVAGTAITYTPAAGYSGADSFTYTATNPGGTSAPATVTITVSPPTLTLAALPTTGELTAAYNAAVIASLGAAPYSYVVTAGALPTGLALTSGGVLSGTATAPGTFNFTITATDVHGATGGQAYAITIGVPTVAITSPVAGALPLAEAWAAYSQTFTATGGVGPRTFALSAGALPPGVSLTGGGVLSGAPTTPGTYNFSIVANDGSAAPGPFVSAPISYSITVTAPTIALTPAAGALPIATTAQAYSQTFTAGGGIGPYSYALTAGALPPGLGLTGGGVLSGAPTASGTYNFTVTAQDSHGFDASNAYSITVADPVVTVTFPAAGALPSAEAGAAYSHTFAATGGTGPRTFALSAGALPPGLSLASGGVLSGAPTTPGTFNFGIVASDSSGAPGPFVSAPVSYGLTVTAPTIALAPAAGGLSAAITAQPYSQTFTTSGGVGPYSYALTAGALPPGLGLTSGGVLSGAPTAIGTYNFTVTAQDSHGFDASNAYWITVADPVVTVTSPAAGALPSVQARTAYSQTFTATGGTGPRSFGLSAGALPPGMSLTSGGLLSGAPTTPGTFNFSIVASDGSGAPGPFTSAPAAYSLTVTAPTISFTPATLPDGMTGQAYAQALTASGGTAAYGYALTAGALPPGITLAAGGSLSGAPTAVGAHDFTIRATDAHGFSADNVYSLLIIDAAPVAVADAASTPANQAVDIAVTANDTGVITSVAVAGAPAHGTAVVNGLAVTYTPGPNYFGADSFTYTATGPGGTGAGATVTVTVTPLAVPTAAAKALTVPAGQSGSVNATAGSTGAPITGVAVATAPTNGTVVVAGQDLVYTPGAAYSGADSFTYTLTNPFGVSTPATVTVTVNPAPVTAAPITIEILAGQTASVNLTADATGGPFTAAAVVSLTPATAGVAAITNPAAGQYGLTFTPAADFAGTVTATYTLSNAFATSATGRVTVIVTARPDPGADPEVTGLISAQGESARRFATAQISNVSSRLESLRDGGGGTSLRLNFAGGSRELADEHDPLRRRLDTDDWADVLPGMSYGGDPMNALDGEPIATAGGSTQGRFGLWAAGGIDFGQRDGTAGQSGVEFDTDGLTAGADLRISDQVVLGASVGWAQDESRIGDDGTRSNAEGRSYAVYGSYQPGQRFFIDGVVGHGTLDFDSRRHITPSGEFAYGQRDGSQSFGALTGGWDMRDGRRLLSPYGRLSATRSDLGAFAETTGGAYALAYESQTVRTLTGTLGLRSAWSWPTSYGDVTPRLRFEYSHDFQGAERANLFYVDWIGGPVYGVEVDPLDQNRVLGGFGLDMLARGGARFSFDYEIGIASGAEQHRFQLEILTRF